ncbi:MAG: 3-hydroxyacyl-CoA dehydrogenase family protein [Cenarchaeum sp. SB0662_bin_33]|nr:3-hydroxyacyl-CoA dehydrogenase family protein [Cenarchaeum sp. SB0664_bin_35]MYB46977.1 3-hydroxyacyl-CoA dehydrogenase family protein [Cenarchaeum sp. SB0662_bin_33]
MGHGIAQISAMAGYNVKLRDIKEEFLDNAMEKIRWSLSKMVKKNKITPQEESSILSRITPVVDMNDALNNSDLVIEVVPENMDIKRKVYAELDSIAAPDTIFASNTSTLPITEIAKTTNRKDMVIGVHFFNPPQLMKLVEVIPGADTSSHITEVMENFVKALGKTPVICRRDVPGFIINRLFIPMVHEALYMMERQNISKEVVDSSVRFHMGFPMGIFELADFTGLDVIHKASNEMFSRDKKVLRQHPTIQQLFEENKLGQKSGEGFYMYSDTKYERIELSVELADKCNPIDIIANITNNAAWLITNNVSNTVEIDKATALGLGLKISLFETAKNTGIQKIIDSLNNLTRQYGQFYEPDPFLRTLAENSE